MQRIVEDDRSTAGTAAARRAGWRVPGWIRDLGLFLFAFYLWMIALPYAMVLLSDHFKNPGRRSIRPLRPIGFGFACVVLGYAALAQVDLRSEVPAWLVVLNPLASAGFREGVIRTAIADLEAIGDPFGGSLHWDGRGYYSVGPDGVDDGMRIAYDPTNGTVSGGDIRVLRVPPAGHDDDAAGPEVPGLEP